MLDVQTDLLDVLTTRVIAPLYTMKSIPKPILHLNPVLQFNGESLVLSIAELAAIGKVPLGEPIGNVCGYRDEIIAALDFVFTGI